MTIPTDFPCYVCGERSYRSLSFGYHFRERDLRAIRCLNCGLIFIHPQPAQDEIASMYGEEYFTSANPNIRPHGRGDYFQSVADTKENVVYRKRLAQISRYSTGKRLLEIGCGPGHFLKMAKETGWEVAGIEISDFAAQYAREEFGLNVLTGTIDTVNLNDQLFDVIFMGDLLEHVTDPKRFLAKVGKYLSEKGILYIEIPAMTNGLYSRVGSIFMRCLHKIKFINLPPYHLFEFTPGSIRNLMINSNYKVLQIQQGIVSPRDIGLHDSFSANSMKIALQTANFVITELTGRLGDRLIVVANGAEFRRSNRQS
ncbi:MAG: class I SAM-dependent methyltransferase [bacterium]|nr:class I SAM-dependent methyltransferase [bacterium]